VKQRNQSHQNNNLDDPRQNEFADAAVAKFIKFKDSPVKCPVVETKVTTEELVQI
jgi:hypothetical protein